MFKAKFLNPAQIEARYALAKALVEQELLDCHLTRLVNDDPGALALNETREQEYRQKSASLDLDFRATMQGQPGIDTDAARSLVEAPSPLEER